MALAQFAMVDMLNQRMTVRERLETLGAGKLVVKQMERQQLPSANRLTARWRTLRPGCDDVDTWGFDICCTEVQGTRDLEKTPVAQDFHLVVR